MGNGERATLDDLFRLTAMRRPHAIALIDPPNRETFTDGPVRRLTYAQADRTINAIAGRLRRIGLNTDAIVGLQLANTVESVLTLLAVLRAGLIAMPLPLLWRRAEAVAALSRVSAQALIVSGRVGGVDHFGLAMQVAAETFPVRFICGFGTNPPDGVIGLDDLHTAEWLDPLPSADPQRAQPPGPGAHVAAITWDVSLDGLIPVARSHAQLVAGGTAVMLESRCKRDATILSTLPLSSFAGLAVGVVPWLLVGGTLALHHPFDSEAFAAQRIGTPFDTVILPGPLVGQFAEAGYLSARDHLKAVVGVWRAPESLIRASTWQDPDVGLVDVQVFGEIGLIAARRDPTGWPAAIAFGAVTAPRGAEDATGVMEVQRTVQGTVALRGPMVPHCAFPTGAERAQVPHLPVAPNGFVDTGYGCKREPSDAAMALSAPPPGLVNVGGYRFVMRHLQHAVSQIDGSGTLTALPDALTGHQLAGSATDPERLQAALAELGLNPLLVGAFSTRQRPAAAGSLTGH
jgi:hypothetical protein